MIRAVVFDCFGVLYRDHVDLLYDLVPSGRQQELQDIIHACDHGFISRSDYFDLIADLTGKTTDEIRDVDKRQHVRNEPLVEYALALKGKFKVGLLSNIGDETMDQLFPADERERLFDAFVLSSQVGLVKPAVQLFELTAEKLGLLPEECVMVDDLLKNVDGARRAGMHALLFTNNRQFREDFERLVGLHDA